MTLDEAIAQIQRERAEAQRAFAQSTAQIEALTAALAERQAELAAHRRLSNQLQRQVGQLSVQVAELTAMLRRFMKDPPARPAEPPDDDPEPPDPPAPAALGGGGPEPKSGKNGRKPKAPGRGGRRGPGATLDAEVVDAPTPPQCPHCPDGGRLLARDTEVTVKLTAVRGFIRRKIIRRPVCVCARCNQRVNAEMPPLPWAGSQFTPEFVALVVYMKFVLMVPLDRMQKALAAQGADLPLSTLVYIIARAAELLGPIDGEHWRQLKAGPTIQVDATGFPVQVAGLHRLWHGFLDVFCRDHLHVYQYSATKHADGLAEKLAGYAGTIVCDAEARNGAALGAAVEANCNAHPRRKFKDAAATQPVLAQEGKSFLDRMFAIEADARRAGVRGEALRALRKSQTRPIADAFRAWLVRIEPALVPSDPLRKQVSDCLRHFDGLTRFIDDPDIPIDNNLSERSFQMHARLRHNAMFAGSHEGAHRWAVLLGVCTTAKRLGVDVLAYLTWAIERRGTHRGRFNLPVRETTPAAYRVAVAAGARGVGAGEGHKAG